LTSGLLVAAALLLATPPRAGADAGLPTPSGWPLAGAIEVLRAFDPPARRWEAGHRGVDLAASVGDPVLAAAGGTVTYAGPLAGRGVVVVRHGLLRTTYEPVRAAVAVGQRVHVGAPLGTLQRESHCSRPCLHWGLRRGEEYLDPLGLGAHNGTVRLLPAAERAAVQRRAAARALAADRAAEAAALVLASISASQISGPAGRQGFLRPVPGRITSPYGRRFHPVLRVWKHHDGTDFGAPCGTPIRAAAAGRVSSTSDSAGYGKRLMLDHGTVGGRRVVTGYNHASRYVVGSGTRVARGEVIGHVGSTGYSTGCHLHLMVWQDGARVDPMRWF